MSPSISPQTRNAAVLSELRHRILHGTLKPGDRILADAIAEELGVSRIPVREALRVLEGERQVSYEPHHGYFVTELRFADLLELYLMRHLLEAEALQRSVPLLDDEDFERMEVALKQLDRAHKAGDIAKHSIANRSFHFAFFEQLGMPRFLDEIAALYDQCEGYGSLFYDSIRNRETSKRDHLALYRAAKEHNTVKVISLLSHHREHLVDALRDVLEGENGARLNLEGSAKNSRTPRPRRREHAASRNR
jgi:DNA-binding GntR family transcriptional regulator